MEHGAPVPLVVDAADRVGAVLRAVLPAYTRRRGVVVLVHGRGPSTPWNPSDRSIAGVVETAVDLGIATRWTALGRGPTALGALGRIAGPDSDRRTLAVRLGPTACELPRAWVGRHAVVLAPAVLDADGGDGPFAAALAAIAVAAHAHTDGRVADPIEVGAAIVAQVFAGFTWVLDAERAVLRSRRSTAAPRAFDVSRVAVHGATGLDDAEVGRRARLIDAWAQRRATTSPGDPGLELVGAKAADPWLRGAGVALGADGTPWSTRPRAREARRP
ncbi:MAG: hypothetical protein JNK45_24325 [Myxococcales bacterium]|nr:hypothetical protein [Myxococcales bacterium]